MNIKKYVCLHFHIFIVANGKMIDTTWDLVHITVTFGFLPKGKDTDFLIGLLTELQRLYSTSQVRDTAVVTLVVLLPMRKN